MSSEVQNTGISGPTKRTHVLHLKKKELLVYGLMTSVPISMLPPPPRVRFNYCWREAHGNKYTMTKRSAKHVCKYRSLTQFISDSHSASPFKDVPVFDSVSPFPHSRSKGHARTVKVNGEGHCVQKVKDNQRLAERVYLFARGRLKHLLEADFLLPTFCFRLRNFSAWN